MTQEQKLEIVRGQFFDRGYQPYLTIYNDTLSFNNRCVELLSSPDYVQIIAQRDGRSIRIRGCDAYDFDAVRWVNIKKGQRHARKIRSKMFIAMLFNKVGFDFGHKYRLAGHFHNTDVAELIFSLDDPEVYVLDDSDEKHRFIQVFPSDWKDSFGIPVSEHKGHQISIFEDYTVLDVSLKRVEKTEEAATDATDIEKMRELKERFIRG